MRFLPSNIQKVTAQTVLRRCLTKPLKSISRTLDRLFEDIQDTHKVTIRKPISSDIHRLALLVAKYQDNGYSMQLCSDIYDKLSKLFLIQFDSTYFDKQYAARKMVAILEDVVVVNIKHPEESMAWGRYQSLLRLHKLRTCPPRFSSISSCQNLLHWILEIIVSLSMSDDQCNTNLLSEKCIYKLQVFLMVIRTSSPLRYFLQKKKCLITMSKF